MGSKTLGARNDGDALGQDLSRLIGGAVDTLAELTALPANKRTDGMIVVVMAAVPYVATFYESSAATASATVLAPDVGTGRWFIGGPANLKKSLVAGGDETGAGVTFAVPGIAAGDHLVAFEVFDPAGPSFAARLTSDFTVGAAALTVVANAAVNTGNQYHILWLDLT